MESAGNTESWFYLRARAIADYNPNPISNEAELLQSAQCKLKEPRQEPYNSNYVLITVSFYILAVTAEIQPLTLA